MGGKTKRAKPEVEKRGRWDRRDPLRDRRMEDRRMSDRRKKDRRKTGRRIDFCPTCGGALTLTSYCPSCKIRVVKVRITAKR